MGTEFEGAEGGGSGNPSGSLTKFVGTNLKCKAGLHFKFALIGNLRKGGGRKGDRLNNLFTFFAHIAMLKVKSFISEQKAHF